MKVCLIWEMIPESTDLYIIEDPSQDDLDLLKAADSKYVNSDEEVDSVVKISDFISPEDSYCQNPGDPSNCKWSSMKVESPYEGQVNLIVKTGWYA